MLRTTTTALVALRRPSPALYSIRLLSAVPQEAAAVVQEPADHWEDSFTGIRVNWFPGHMVKAQRLMRTRLKQVDMVLEVRDARVPFSSANGDLDKLIANKARLVVLNKEDLADPAMKAAVAARLRAEVSLINKCN
jgi:hypothetical protein